MCSLWSHFLQLGLLQDKNANMGPIVSPQKHPSSFASSSPGSKYDSADTSDSALLRAAVSAATATAAGLGGGAGGASGGGTGIGESLTGATRVLDSGDTSTGAGAVAGSMDAHAEAQIRRLGDKLMDMQLRLAAANRSNRELHAIIASQRLNGRGVSTASSLTLFTFNSYTFRVHFCVCVCYAFAPYSKPDYS